MAALASRCRASVRPEQMQAEVTRGPGRGCAEKPPLGKIRAGESRHVVPPAVWEGYPGLARAELAPCPEPEKSLAGVERRPAYPAGACCLASRCRPGTNTEAPPAPKTAEAGSEACWQKLRRGGSTTTKRPAAPGDPAPVGFRVPVVFCGCPGTPRVPFRPVCRARPETGSRAGPKGRTPPGWPEPTCRPRSAGRGCGIAAAFDDWPDGKMRPSCPDARSSVAYGAGCRGQQGARPSRPNQTATTGYELATRARRRRCAGRQPVRLVVHPRHGW